MRQIVSVAAPWVPAPRLPMAPPADVIEALMRLAEVAEPVEALRPSVRQILEVVGESYDITVGELCSARMSRRVTGPRQEAMWLARALTLRSLPEIGRFIGGRDHTTILHGVRAVEARRAGDPDLAARLDALGARVMARAWRRCG